MDLNPYIRSLREDLLAAAAIGDEEIRRAAAILGAAIEPAGRLAIMNALSDLAAEVTEALDRHVVEIKLDGRDVRVSVSDRGGPSSNAFETHGSDGSDDDLDGASRHGHHLHADDLRRAMQEAGGELSRTTVRLFNDLKSQAEQAASDQGVSLNTYISRAVSDSVRTAVPPGMKGKRDSNGRSGNGRTVTGYIKG
ncbi:hypothetical protein ABIB25_000517 [Nakamurella sp. UYEF19]|uniref:toxin-antitoxin system HicB family antitoxin n=1 Tax=Nakamurella sp. UYEF19 TaxID=1756392 RepID=UPI0033983045